MAENTGKPIRAKSTNRRKARELALHTLYACEVGETREWESTFALVAKGGSYTGANKRYARELVRKALSSSEVIDEYIARHSANWELRRMAALDRNVLRLAATELLFFSAVPFRVVIDEAVELAKIYGTDESGGFVNGIIDSIYKERAEDSERKEG
jgi:N utilization substance protein B